MYKIGIGPSSSHTFGPMVAGNDFVKHLSSEQIVQIKSLKATLFGSLSLTGKGHLTDSAVILGLSGEMPESVDLDKIDEIVSLVNKTKKIVLNKQKSVDFELVFCNTALKEHENGMEFEIEFENGEKLSKQYFSVGGGFIKTKDDFLKHNNTGVAKDVPYKFENSTDLLELCKNRKMSEILLENEKALRPLEEILEHSKKVREAMKQAIIRGLNSEGYLPEPTRLLRRAKELHTKLKAKETNGSSIMVQMDWVNLFALAVSEENGAGGRVVTAPTNGACGVIPAILAYHDKFVETISDEALLRFYLVSAAIGAIFKKNASIAGAEVGCQGEIGVASAMAAAGLAEIYGANAKQICIAAEVAMEHHLGLTCDPVNGQVQIPCVERNSVAAVTAINATAISLSRSVETARVSLDDVVEAMRATGKDMDSKYRETSCGGLALVVN